MNVRVQRLYRARTSIPFILKRCKATASASNESSAPSQAPAPRIDQGVETTFKTFQKWFDSDVTPIKKYLVDEYQVDRDLSQVAKALNKSDAISAPKLEEEGISINFRTWNGDEICVFPNFWLRDNCRCSKCVNQDTMQRAFDTFSIPHDVKPKSAITKGDGLLVTWDHDDHVYLYPWAWLWKHRRHPGNPLDVKVNERGGSYTLWGSEIGKGTPPSVLYDEIMADDKGVGSWTQKIREYGFCYVDGCPISPEKTKELLERIAFIRVTHYGGFYDFTSDLTMKDTAYTSLALGAHTDTTYFTDPAGLQMFHLLSHTEGDGGASLLVDGFKAAAVLREESFEHFKTLSNVVVPWHASGNEGITITPAKKYPVLNYGELPPRGGVQRIRRDKHGPELLQIRWNNDDRGVLSLDYKNSRPRAKLWYEAAREFDKILKRDDMQYWAQLEPGRPLIFDNWRVMHGRSAFTGKRRICGGYINHDDFISRWRNTNFTREEVLSQIL